ncbi:hypothetical protein IRZ70_06235 [Pseudomonas monteilii]|nr:hypothetical protein [Pseudomonas monteilii]
MGGGILTLSGHSSTFMGDALVQAGTLAGQVPKRWRASRSSRFRALPTVFSPWPATTPTRANRPSWRALTPIACTRTV